MVRGYVTREERLRHPSVVFLEMIGHRLVTEYLDEEQGSGIV